ncbi:MAG: hypothetical protein IJT66_05855 [Clostridia bacterium]|nr:hypothetical protein [Clostridia bacterium]
MKPTKQQRETLISFNERDDRVEVITYNTSLIKRLTELHNNHPDCCELTCADTEIGRYEFSVSKRNFTFRVMNPYTKARKTAMQYYAIWHDTIAAVKRKDKQNERNQN